MYIKWNIQLILVTLSSMICLVLSYGRGAPRGDSVCKHLLPHHHVMPQTGKCPYIVTANVTSESSEHYVITINLKSHEGHHIKGFAVQISSNSASRDTGDVLMIGQFLPRADVKVFGCSADSDTATHTNNGEKQQVTILANVRKGLGLKGVYVRATLLQEYDIFWSDVIFPIHVPSGTAASSGKNYPLEWMKAVSKTARNIKAGYAHWNEDIKNRLKLGYSEIVDSSGHLKPILITESLPYMTKYPKRGFGVTSGGLYTSSKDPHDSNLNQNDAIRELLQGDIRFAELISITNATKV